MAPTPAPDFGDDPVNFFVPGRDRGLWRLCDPAPLWKPVPGGRFRGAQLSEIKRINALWRAEQAAVREDRLFLTSVEFGARVAVVEDVTITRDCIAIGGKWAISGPMGERLLARNSKLWSKAHADGNWNAQLTNHIETSQEFYSEPPLWKGSTDDLPFVIEASNLSNYYHFTKELMSSLSLLADLPNWRGQICIVSERPEPSGFATRWLAALFPEFAERIVYQPSPQSFERALTVWHGDFDFFRAGAPDVEALAGPEHPLARNGFSTSLAKQLRFGGYGRGLTELRARAFGAIRDLDMTHLPRRFWVGRKPGEAHDRRLDAEDEIVANLAQRGFEQVYFEDLSPFEQIGIMAQAEVMVSYHGAGFANMLYAAPTAHVIELGTLQTGRIRLGDFLAFAHVSQAHYVVAVADFADAGNAVIPPMRGHGIYPVRLSARGMRRLMALVDDLDHDAGNA